MFARQGIANNIFVNALDGVYRHDTGDRRSGPRRFCDHFLHQFRMDERPYRVMYRNQFRVRSERRQRMLHRFLAALATLDESHGFLRMVLVHVLLMNQPLRPIQVFPTQRDHDFADRRAAQEFSDGVDENRRALKRHELLAAHAGLLAPHARAEPRSGQDNGYFH